MNLQEIPAQKLIAELKRRGYEIKEPEKKGLREYMRVLEYTPNGTTYKYFGLAPPKT